MGQLKFYQDFKKRRTKQYAPNGMITAKEQTKVVSWPEYKVMLALWLSGTFLPNSNNH